MFVFLSWCLFFNSLEKKKEAKCVQGQCENGQWQQLTGLVASLMDDRHATPRLLPHCCHQQSCNDITARNRPKTQPITAGGDSLQWMEWRGVVGWGGFLVVE
jgi:hypothetical protein